MFNVQSKTRQELSLVYSTNQTKRLMEKTKKKTIEQSSIRKGSPMDESLWREGFKERYLLSLEWKRVGVTESDSGDDDTDELRELC